MPAEKMNNLKGKVAVITGGGGVLCSEFAKILAANSMPGIGHESRNL